MNWSRAFIHGRLGKDPVIKTTPSGKRTADMSVATSSAYRDKNGAIKPSTHWHKVFVTSQQLVERCEALRSGMEVCLWNLKIENVKFNKLGSEEVVQYTQFKVDAKSDIFVVRSLSSEDSDEIPAGAPYGASGPMGSSHKEEDEDEEVPF